MAADFEGESTFEEVHVDAFIRGKMSHGVGQFAYGVLQERNFGEGDYLVQPQTESNLASGSTPTLRMKRSAFTYL